ncbi:MAG: hypothetical protein ABI273_13725 [Lacunisphaera sp.]
MARPTTLLSFLLLALMTGSGRAQSALTKPTPEQEAPKAEPAPLPDDSQKDPANASLLSRVNGLFTGDLPQLDLPGKFKLIFRPHMGDFTNRDYFRLDAGARWALNENFELTAQASAYLNNGLRDSASDGYGIGRVWLGSNYVFEHWPYRDYETSLTLDAEIPTGHPPIDMTDGNYHLTPTIVTQHNWASWRRLTTFGGVGLDIVGRSNIIGTYGTNDPHDHSMSFIAGAVYDVGQLKWTVTGTYATTALITSHPANFYYLQPGVLWYVPSRFTFHSKTQWILGLGVRGTWGPDGFHFSTNSRVRAEITFSQFMEKIHKTTTPSP